MTRRMKGKRTRRTRGAYGRGSRRTSARNSTWLATKTIRIETSRESCRFTTTESDGPDIKLDEYCVSGESLDVMQKALALQIFRRREMEVLMLADHLDEPRIQKLADTKGKARFLPER